jgi:lipoprotein-anchoring transpeptidase ErfK/SrfK
MHFGEYVWNDRSVPAGAVSVRVDLKAQLISVFRAGHEIGTAVILYGAESKQTPSGVFPILAKMKDHRSSLYDADMPYTLRLTGDGISIHGSVVSWGRATHGCIGLPIEFAALLFAQVKVGDKVQIDIGQERG